MSESTNVLYGSGESRNEKQRTIEKLPLLESLKKKGNKCLWFFEAPNPNTRLLDCLPLSFPTLCLNQEKGKKTVMCKEITKQDGCKKIYKNSANWLVVEEGWGRIQFTLPSNGMGVSGKE